MSQENIGALAGKIYDLVQGLKTEEVTKVFDAVATLCGITHRAANLGNSNGNGASTEVSDAASYLANKSPKSKMEELAVAARFREIKNKEKESAKEDFAAFFTEASANFDAVHFSRDMGNAKDNGFFVKQGGKKTHAHQLSYYGRSYIDALPDREKAKAAKRKVRKARKPKAKTAKS